MNTIRRAPLSEPVLMLFLFIASGNGNESADDEGLQTAIQLSLEEAQHANSTKLEEDKKTDAVKTGMHEKPSFLSLHLILILSPVSSLPPLPLFCDTRA